MPVVDVAALSALIDFIYTSHIDIDQDNVQSLLTAARYLLMTEIEVADMIIVSNHLITLSFIRKCAATL